MPLQTSTIMFCFYFYIQYLYYISILTGEFLKNCFYANVFLAEQKHVLKGVTSQLGQDATETFKCDC